MDLLPVETVQPVVQLQSRFLAQRLLLLPADPAVQEVQAAQRPVGQELLQVLAQCIRAVQVAQAMQVPHGMMAAVAAAVVELQQMVLTELLPPVELKLQRLLAVPVALPAEVTVELVVRQVQVLLPAELHLHTVAVAAELQVIIQEVP